MKQEVQDTCRPKVANIKSLLLYMVCKVIVLLTWPILFLHFLHMERLLFAYSTTNFFSSGADIREVEMSINRCRLIQTMMGKIDSGGRSSHWFFDQSTLVSHRKHQSYCFAYENSPSCSQYALDIVACLVMIMMIMNAMRGWTVARNRNVLLVLSLLLCFLSLSCQRSVYHKRDVPPIWDVQQIRVIA